MARELSELKAGMEPYELPFLSSMELVALLKERHLLIDVDEHEAEFWLQSVGYFHLKGYLAVLKEPQNREYYRAGTKFSDAINLMLWERQMRGLLLEQLGKVELRFRSAIVECIGTGRGDGYLDDANYDVSRLKNEKAIKQDRRSNMVMSDWDWFVGWIDSRVKSALGEKDYEFVASHARRRKNQPLPLWILIETMTLGDLINLYERLSPQNRASVASKFANGSVAGGQLKENEFLRILEALRNIRNLASHFHAFFDKQVPFPSLTEFRSKFRECPYFPSLAANRKNCTLYEVVLMLLYLEPAVQQDSSFSAEIATVLSGFPASIQGVTEKIYGGHKGWHLDYPWRSNEVSDEAGDDEKVRDRNKKTKASYAKGKRRR